MPAFTINQIYKSALEKLYSCANEIGVELTCVECTDVSKTFPGFLDVTLGLEGKHQFENAALATQLCSTWMGRVVNKELTFEELKLGLQKVNWPGRCQTLPVNENLVFYLDGAHTCLSLHLCKSWFDSKIINLIGSVNNNEFDKVCHNTGEYRKVWAETDKIYKVLICSFTNQRNDEELIRSLDQGLHFDNVIFCDVAIFKLPSLAVNSDSQKEASARCLNNQKLWSESNEECNVQASASIEEALKMAIEISEESSKLGKKTCVLVTGSLYLVGGFLKLLNDFRNEA